MIDTIVEMRFGSHLYGTATEQSDLDLKAVFLPDGRDILLQRVSATMSRSSGKPSADKNVAGDIDHELFCLHRYLELLAEGQTMALDMLFALDSAMTMRPAPLWRDIQANTERLVTRRASAFVRYCRQQANKFGLKGGRLGVAREALALLSAAEERHGATAKLAIAEPEVTAFAASSSHTALIDLPMPNGKMLRHLDVCGKKMPFSASIKSGREMAARMVDEYGARALQAERNEGIDWKALSHAVRVGREAVELFRTGRINFPLGYASELLSIRRGAQPYETVADKIEDLLIEVEHAAATCTLRDTPDQGFIDDLVANAYRAQVLKSA